MIDSVKQFFDKFIKISDEEPKTVSAHSLQLATAALFLEMKQIDRDVAEAERRKVAEALQAKFGLDDEETESLVRVARRAVKNSLSYHEFTSLINKGFTPEQKVRVVEHLWEIAYADGELDKHEEHLVRKIADLIYVPHRDYIDAKLRVRDRMLRDQK